MFHAEPPPFCFMLFTLICYTLHPLYIAHCAPPCLLNSVDCFPLGIWLQQRITGAAHGEWNTGVGRTCT